MEPTKNKIILVMLDTREVIISEVLSDAAGRATVTPAHGYVFITPALVIVQRGAQGTLGFMLTPWLPHEVLSNTNIEFRNNKVIGILNAHPNLVSFYTSWAETERDKMVEFGQDFAVQIAELEKYQKDKYARTKAVHTEGNKVPMPNQHSPLTGAIYEMFDHDENWGDPSVSH
jgi:hypothetical protein